jgi:hypothetical protein
MKYTLPINYNLLHWTERREVRLQYIEEQNGICAYCGSLLSEEAPIHIRQKKINWELFPAKFMSFPVHLQHNHDTGMTESAVHNYCNAVMWQYENR